MTAHPPGAGRRATADIPADCPSAGRFHIRTFGCQMNVADSEIMAGILESRGLIPTDDPGEADIIVVNTCTIRQKAAEKAYSELGRFLGFKRRRGGGLRIVAASGCLAKQDGEGLLKRLPGLDIVLGPSRIGRLGEMLDEREATGRPAVDVKDTAVPLGDIRPARERKAGAFVTIMRGCDNACAYCVVPSVRGSEVSRPPDEIEAQVRGLIDLGCREVTLLGQNVNSYGRGLSGSIGFPDLLERLDRRTGIARIRFTTSHPRDFGADLVAAVRDLPSVCEAVHLPVQSGSDAVLAAMNRGYTCAEYREKVDLLRREVPGVCLSTDIIVGFPAETDSDFEETARLVRETGFAGLFAFKFSPRPGTPAAAVPDRVPFEEKDRRLQIILSLQEGIGSAWLRSMEGSTVEVLVEGPSKSDPRRLTGRTRGNLVVNFPGDPRLAGDLVNVRIARAGPHSLVGEESPPASP